MRGQLDEGFSPHATPLNADLRCGQLAVENFKIEGVP